jgi:hypothetical protein
LTCIAPIRPLQLCADGGYQPSLGVLGVPLIMVPDRHRRLAHVGMKNLHKLLKGEHILGVTNVHFKKDKVCSACQAGKQVGVHHPHKNIMTTDRPLELLHMDLFDPIAYISIGGSKTV